MTTQDTPTLDQRAAFEAHFSKPPFEWEFSRYGEDSAWPGNYRQYEHQCAWEGYQAGRAALAFPAGYVLPESKRLAIHMLGNAVPPPMTAAVINAIRRQA